MLRQLLNDVNHDGMADNDDKGTIQSVKIAAVFLVPLCTYIGAYVILANEINIAQIYSHFCPIGSKLIEI
jgi:hypothetical protein